MHADPDVVVIGSGPNGLVAGCYLARQGLRVAVLEAHPRRPGGALATEELTLPGFLHDVGAAFFPMMDSPAFRDLGLASTGLEWCHAPFDSCHPALDGSYAAISRDVERTAQHFGSAEDGAAWRKLTRIHRRMGPAFDEALLGPIFSWRPLFRLGVRGLWHLLRSFATSPGSFSRRWFASEAARRVLPGLAMHAEIPPSEPLGSALGYVLAVKAGSTGFPFPVGGARSVTNALVTLLERHGGHLLLDAPVSEVLVREGRACAVRLRDGREIRALRGVLADTSFPRLVRDLVDPRHWPERLLQKARDFVQGPGTFKVDWALSGPTPWTCDVARQSAVVHTGESLTDLDRWSQAVRRGELGDRPYLVIGQQSLFDTSRAPAGQHTLYAYSRIPSTLPGGWTEHAERFADAIEARIEELAPGFRVRILHRNIQTPEDLEQTNENLIGGDIGGGANGWNHQLLLRPAFPYFRYALPIRGLYLCSSYAHPGAGTHGMCGYNAARRAAAELT